MAAALVKVNTMRKNLRVASGESGEVSNLDGIRIVDEMPIRNRCVAA